MLQRELRYDELKEFFWKDSQVVLAYIQNDTRRFKTYVANRVQQIRDHTTPNQWNYVESKHNPADDASRGFSVQRSNMDKGTCIPMGTKPGLAKPKS